MDVSSEYCRQALARGTGAQFTMALRMVSPDPHHRKKERLRIGVAIDSYIVSAWIAAAIDDLRAAEFVELSTVVLTGSGGVHRFRSWTYEKYVRWNEGHVPLERDPLKTVDIAGVLADIEVIEALAGAPTASVRERKLAVLVWFASGEPAAGLEEAAEHGIWMHRNGDPRAYRGEPSYFWELYEKDPVTDSVLEAIEPGGGGPRVLYRAVSATEQGWSLQHNRAVPYWRLSRAALRCLRDLYEGQGSTGRLAAGVTYDKSGHAMRQSPNAFQMARFVAQNVWRTVSRRARYSSQEGHWFVAYRTEESQFVANSGKFDPSGFEILEAPKGHSYADPFVAQWGARRYLFVEDYLYEQRKGCLSVMEIDERGRFGEAQRILERPYHLSYPFVFASGGEWFMIPETSGAGQIELYRAMGGPLEWELVKILKQNVQAVDTTVWEQDGTWYFFTNIAERGATVNDELFVFHADHLLGEWRPHPANPVCVDVRRSRGAGKLFRQGGRLVRPSQDCSVRYGYACQLNEVEKLSPREYRERPLFRIEPDWRPGLIATHTINSDAGIEVIDGQVYRPRRLVS